LNDCNNAIQLDETNIKAYLRKGTALYNQDSKEEALKTFIRGLELDCKCDSILFIKIFILSF